MSRDSIEKQRGAGVAILCSTSRKKIARGRFLSRQTHGRFLLSSAALSLLAVLVAVAAASGQTKAVEALKDESSITYRINHTLHHIEATSKDGWFRVELDPSKKEIKSVTAQVDVMTFDSGNSNRDSHAMEVVESIKYPDAVFLGTGVTQTGDSIRVTGKLTFHGVTNDIIMTGVAKWSADKLLVKGGFDITLTAYKIERPSLLMIPVEDILRFSLEASFAF